MKKRQRGGFGVQFAATRGGTTGASPFRDAYARVNQGRTQTAKDNFLQSEAMRREAAALQSAPFEGDQALRDELLKNTDDFLTQMAESGRYEDASIAVTRAVTDYSLKAAPIKENLTRYTDFVNQQKEDLKEGRISHKQYQGNLALATKAYEAQGGLKANQETGGFDYFQGIQSVEDPNIQKMMQEALSDIAYNEFEGVEEVFQVADPQLAEKHGVDVGAFLVKTTTGIKKIEPDRVEGVLSSLLQEPKVTSWLGRMGDIDSLDADAFVASEAQRLATGMASIEEKLADDSLSPKERQTLLDLRDTYQEEARDINELQAASPETRAAAVKQFSISSNMERYRQQAIGTYAFERRKSGREMTAIKTIKDTHTAAGINVRSQLNSVDLALPQSTGEYREMINANMDQAEATGYKLAIMQGTDVPINAVDDGYEFAGKTYPDRAAAEAAKNEMVQTFANATQETIDMTRRTMLDSYDQAAEEAAILLSHFDTTDPNVTGSQTYQELEQAIAELNGVIDQAGGTDFMSDDPFMLNIRSKREALQRTMEAFNDEHQLDISGATKTSFEASKFIPGLSAKQAQKVNEAVVEQLNFNRQTTMMIPLSHDGSDGISLGPNAELLDIYADNSTMKNVANLENQFAVESGRWINMPGFGQTFVVSLKDSDGNLTDQQVAIPMRKSNGDMNIGVRDVDNYINSNVGKFHTKVQKFEMSRPQSKSSTFNVPITVTDSAGNPVANSIKVTLPARMAQLPGGVNMSIDDPKFNGYIEDGNITLGAKGSYR